MLSPNEPHSTFQVAWRVGNVYETHTNTNARTNSFSHTIKGWHSDVQSHYLVVEFAENNGKTMTSLEGGGDLGGRWRSEGRGGAHVCRGVFAATLPRTDEMRGAHTNPINTTIFV